MILHYISNERKKKDRNKKNTSSPAIMVIVASVNCAVIASAATCL